MWRRWCSLLDHTDGGAEGSVVLQPVQEGSDSLRQRRLQLRDVALELKTSERRVTTCPSAGWDPRVLSGKNRRPFVCVQSGLHAHSLLRVSLQQHALRFVPDPLSKRTRGEAAGAQVHQVTCSRVSTESQRLYK